jgi:hypothetical protein
MLKVPFTYVVALGVVISTTGKEASVEDMSLAAGEGSGGYALVEDMSRPVSGFS